MRTSTLLLLLSMWACTSPTPTEPELESDTDADADADADSDADADADADSDTDADTDTDVPFFLGEANCTDGLDNDGDTFIDCEDYDCQQTMLCPSDCPPDDLYEDNDGLSFPTTGVTSATDLVIHQQDADWYELGMLPSGDAVFVDLTFVDSNGNINATLTNQFADTLDSGTSVTDDESLFWVNNTALAVPVHLYVYQPTSSFDSVCNTYAFDSRFQVIGSVDICDNGLDDDLDDLTDCADYDCMGDAACPDCPTEDATEPNDSFPDALPLPTGTLAVHAQNRDYFTIEVVPDELIEIDASYPTGDTNLYLRLLRANGSEVIDVTGTDGLASLRALVDIEVPERWTIRVDAVDGDCSSYELDVRQLPIPAEVCTDAFDDDLDGYGGCDDYECLTDPVCAGVCPAEDLLEPNNSTDLASTLTEVAGLMVHADDPDWFRIDAVEGELVQATVDWDPTAGEVNLRLFDADLTELDADRSNADPLTVAAVTSLDGPHYLQVSIDPDSLQICSGYDLISLMSGPVPDEDCQTADDDDLDGYAGCMDYDCIDDPDCFDTCPLEDSLGGFNSTLALAVPLTELLGATTHQQSADWYSITVPPGQLATLTAEFMVADGDLELRLFDEDGNPLDASLTSTDNEQILRINDSDEPVTWYAQVTPASAILCGSYDWFASIGPIPDEDCTTTDDEDLDDYPGCEDYDCLEDVSCVGLYPQCAVEDPEGGSHAEVDTAIPLISRTAMVAHEQRRDVYVLDMAPQTSAQVDVRFADMDGNLRLRELAADGTILRTVDSFNDDETLTLLNVGSTSAERYLAVEANDFNGICNTYDIDVGVAQPIPDEVCDDGLDNDLDGFADCEDYECATTPAFCTCPAEDSFEDNDTQQTAAAIGMVQDSLVVFAADEDWFTFTAPVDAAVDVDVLFFQAIADLDAQLVDSNGTVLANGLTGTTNESLNWTNDTGAEIELFVRVFVWSGSAGACNIYTIDIEFD